MLVVGSDGIERLNTLLDTLSEGAGCTELSSIILWQVEPSHALDGKPRSASSELRGTGWRELMDGTLVSTGGRYMVPARHSLRFEGREARIEPMLARTTGALDRLLLSLAESWGERSVCVLDVSDDGACGTRILRSVGGLVLRAPAAARAKRLPRGVRPTAVRAATPADTSTGPHAPRAGAVSNTTRVFSLPPSSWATARSACRAAVRRGIELAGGQVRVWVPKCQHGGTAYATAMLLSDAVRQAPERTRVALYATDDDVDALSVARVGRYSARAALGMNPEHRAHYTFDEGETIRVSEALRALCVFSRHELSSHPPLARIDLVVCHRVFEGVPAMHHARLVEAFHFALRDGGLLLALDHAERFSEELFERVEGGFLRARRGPTPWIQSPWQQRLSCHPQAVGGAGEAAASEAAASEASASDAALPVIACDADQRVSFINHHAMNAFTLFPADVGSKFLALAGRLPGGVDLLGAVRRAVTERRDVELSMRSRGRSHLARIRVADDASGPRRTLTIKFVDVTALEAAHRRSITEQHRRAALTQISQLGAGLATAAPLYDEALSAMFSNVHPSSAGVIAEVAGSSPEWHVVASRGLGADPMRTLRGMGDAITLLEQAVARQCSVSQYGARVSLDASVAPFEPCSARARQARSTLTAGLAHPIVGAGEVFGVLALFARQAALDSPEHRTFASALAGVLAAAIVRHRAQHELAVRRQASSVAGGSGSAAR